MDKNLVVKCSVCNKLRIKVDGVQVWIHAVAAGHSMVSHTYCDDCASESIAEIEGYASECSG